MWKLICNTYRFNNKAAAVVKIHLKIKVVCDTFIWMFKMVSSLGGKNKKKWFAFGYFINDIYLRGDLINIYCTCHLLNKGWKSWINYICMHLEESFVRYIILTCLLLGVTIASVLSILGCFLALRWEAFLWSHWMVSRWLTKGNTWSTVFVKQKFF